MEKIGLYFGSFNPIHNGHLMIANYCIEHYKLDKFIFIVTPQNPFKVNKELAPFQNRIEMPDGGVLMAYDDSRVQQRKKDLLSLTGKGSASETQSQLSQ